MSDIGFTCDVCGRTIRGTTYPNGMKFCAKCRKKTFADSKDWQLLDKDKTIEELKQQLAEITEKYNACQEARKLEIEFNQQDKAGLKHKLAEKENEYLKQLAEKDKEITNIRHEICEKIRNKALALCYYVPLEIAEYFGGNCYLVSKSDLEKIINQIEREEMSRWVY